jgi:hypothetical protein
MYFIHLFEAGMAELGGMTGMVGMDGLAGMDPTFL